MKSLLLTLSLSLIITACGGEEESKAPVVSPNVSKFAIGDSSWQVSLVEGWEKIDNFQNPEMEYEVAYTAKKDTQNFIINRYKGKGGDITQYFYDNAKRAFFFFEGIEKNENQMTFKAQLRAGSPMRTYYQKILEVPGYPYYLLGSCSHESQDTGDDCQKILELWTEVVEEE